METSHWWQRSATPSKSENPFKPDLEALSPFFVQSEIGDSTLAASETPRAKSANPFRSENDDCTRSKTSEQPTAARQLNKPASPFFPRSETGSFTPPVSSTPLSNSRILSVVKTTFALSSTQLNGKSKSRSNCLKISMVDNR